MKVKPTFYVTSRASKGELLLLEWRLRKAMQDLGAISMALIKISHDLQEHIQSMEQAKGE